MAEQTLPLTDFLTARLDEDEATYGVVVAEMGAADPPTPFVGLAERIMREVEVKRQFLQGHDGPHHRCAWGDVTWGDEECLVKRRLAAVYRDHPGYDPDWRP